MKILYHHRTASKDGQFVHIEELTEALKALGHEIIMVGPNAAAEQESFGADGGFVARLKRHMPGFLYELLEFGYNLVVYWKLDRAIKQHKPDCLYERYNLYLPAGVWIKRRHKLPMLLEVNAPLFAERSRYDGIALPSLAKWTEHYTWCGADKVLPVTQVLADYIKQAGVSAEKLVVIPNGINKERFAHVPSQEQAKQRLGLSGRLVLGFTGFIRDWHGLDNVVDFLADAPDDVPRHLLIVGDGPARASIQRRADELGVADKLTITGIIGREQVADYIAAFDIALQPSVVDYASPLKLFEYLALGRAIVAPDKPNIREILSHETNALLFAVDDKNAFALAVKRLCDDAPLRARLGAAAKAAIDEQHLTWDSNAQRVASLFASMIASQRGRPNA